jgi:hypothetical protein
MKATTVTNEQLLKIVKAAAYVGASAAISYLISLIAGDPDLFGPMTPIVNVVLVGVKQIFTDPAK